jgi:hypothetical protein
MWRAAPEWLVFAHASEEPHANDTAGEDLASASFDTDMEALVLPLLAATANPTTSVRTSAELL